MRQWTWTLTALAMMVALAACSAMDGESGASKHHKKAEERGPSDMLKTGEAAPDFTLKDANGKTVTLSGFRGKKNVVLVFYPMDNTPGCTKQLCTIRDDWSMFEKADAQVFGVNPGDAKSHQKFSGKFDFPFPLLIDEDKKVTVDYGAKGLMMTKRTVYGIDKDGKIAFAERGMPSSETILKAFK